MTPGSAPKPLARRARRLIPLGLFVAVVAAAKVALTGHLLINYTPSIPRGVYWISAGSVPQRGELVAVPLPKDVRDLVYGRRYLPPTVELLAKPVAAVGGDHVCIRDRVLFINGAVAGNVLVADREGKPVPNHSICRALGADEVFLVTAHDNSFDSRNFGPLPVATLKGRLSPLLTF